MLISNPQIGQYVRHCVSRRKTYTGLYELYLDREKIVVSMRKMRDFYEEELTSLKTENQKLKERLNKNDAPI